MSELVEIERIRKLIRDVVFDKGNKASIIGNGCFCAENIVNSAYEQGRADEKAIIIDLIDRNLWNYSHEVWEDVQPFLEKLKEQKI